MEWKINLDDFCIFWLVLQNARHAIKKFKNPVPCKYVERKGMVHKLTRQTQIKTIGIL